MSIDAMSWAWRVPNLNPTERLTLLSLADAADSDWYCFPGQPFLMARVGVSKRTIVKTLQDLEDRGLFTRERRTLHNGNRTTDGYRIGQGADSAPGQGADHDMDKVQTAAPTGNHQLTPVANATGEKRARGSRIPEPFMVTAEMWEWARDKGMDRDWAREQTERFVDYWRGVSGQRGVKQDWPGTWRNWLRRAWDDRRTPSTARETPDERFRRLMAQAEAMEAGDGRLGLGQ